MTSRISLFIPAMAAALLLGACADGSNPFAGNAGVTTSSVTETPAADPVCVTLASQIDGLKRDGAADKVALAAAKKYTMKAADLAKADQLNKANADFQARCSTLPKPATTAAVAPVAPTSAGATNQAPAAKQ